MKIEFKTINLSEILLTDRTIKIPDPIRFTKLKQSIKNYGQIHPLIINTNMELIKGYVRYQALSELGIKTANVFKVTENVNENQLRLEMELCVHDIDPIELSIDLKKINRIKHSLPLSETEIDDLIDFLTVDKTLFDKAVREGTSISFL